MTACEVGFVKVSPTQNMTLLIRTEHPVEEYPGIATALMSAGHVHGEQVGFVREPTSPGADTALRMAAGEFFGNACMALAAVCSSEEGLVAGGSVEVVLKSSGVDDVVRCRVERRTPDYRCELAMPLPVLVEPWAAGSTLVPLRGLAARRRGRPGGPGDQGPGAANGAAAGGDPRRPAGRRHGVRTTPPSAPLVHIPSLDGMVWERSCGSGTAALGAHLASKASGPVATDVTQPGGTMRVTATSANGRLAGLTVAGSVRIVAEGTAYVHG